jgi:hypothetical protein
MGASRNGLGFHAGGALGEDHRMSGGKIGWQRFKFRCHSTRESYSSATSKQNCHPTEVGRHVACGLRQSIPESR